MTEQAEIRSQNARAASRLNGAASRGPKTTAGKAHSARNALRHGLRASHPGSVSPMPVWASEMEGMLYEMAAPVDGARRELIEVIVVSGRMVQLADVKVRESLAGLLPASELETAKLNTYVNADHSQKCHSDLARSGPVDLDGRERAAHFAHLNLLLQYEQRFRRRRDRAMRKLLRVISNEARRDCSSGLLILHLKSCPT